MAVWWFSGSGEIKWAISLKDMVFLHEIELGEELGWPSSGAIPYALLEALFLTISPFSVPYLPAVPLPQGNYSKTYQGLNICTPKVHAAGIFILLLFEVAVSTTSIHQLREQRRHRSVSRALWLHLFNFYNALNISRTLALDIQVF